MQTAKQYHLARAGWKKCQTLQSSHVDLVFSVQRRSLCEVGLRSSNKLLLNRNGSDCHHPAKTFNILSYYSCSTVQRGPEIASRHKAGHTERKGHSQAINGCGQHFSELLEEVQILNPRMVQTMT